MRRDINIQSDHKYYRTNKFSKITIEKSIRALFTYSYWNAAIADPIELTENNSNKQVCFITIRTRSTSVRIVFVLHVVVVAAHDRNKPKYTPI